MQSRNPTQKKAAEDWALVDEKQRPSDRAVGRAWSAATRAGSRSRPVVDLPPGSLVLGDLHLEVEQPAQVARFEAYLESLVGTPRLVLLGDLFEFWFGDGQGASSGGARALAALARLAGTGCAIDLIPGNRDFLVGRRFERSSGVLIRPHGLIGILPGGRRVLAIHGDELCTDDLGYQRMSRVLRSTPIRFLSRIVPGALAGAFARRMRRASQSALAVKPPKATEQQPLAAAHLAAKADAQYLVCGHAHRYREEALGEPAEGSVWMVLDELGYSGAAGSEGQAADGGIPGGARAVRDALLVNPTGALMAQASGYPRAHSPGDPKAEGADGLLSGPRGLSSGFEMHANQPQIIAIDGPAGAGKSTVARRVAGELGLPFLDTGAMYRAVAWICLEREVDLSDDLACGAVAEQIELEFDDGGRIWVDGRPGEPAIRSREVERVVSQVAAHALVRQHVVAQQQRLGESGPGLVAEGRDTTTVVFPRAGHKFFLWASPEARAERRALQMGNGQAKGQVLTEILERDALDGSRKLAPLRQAPDAVRIDADDQTADQVAKAILEHVRGHAGEPAGASKGC